jgi:hypothetical protein
MPTRLDDAERDNPATQIGMTDPVNFGLGPADKVNSI